MLRSMVSLVAVLLIVPALSIAKGEKYNNSVIEKQPLMNDIPWKYVRHMSEKISIPEFIARWIKWCAFWYVAFSIAFWILIAIVMSNLYSGYP